MVNGYDNTLGLRWSKDFCVGASIARVASVTHVWTSNAQATLKMQFLGWVEKEMIKQLEGD